MCGKKQVYSPRPRRKRANGSGTIYKLQGNRKNPWAVARGGVYIGAYTTYQDAQKCLDRLTDADIGDRFNMTFSQVYAAWAPEHSRTLTASGIAGYAAAYNHCAPLYGVKFRSLRASDFQRIIITLEREGKAKSSCEKLVQLFSQLSQWAIRENIATVNYAKYLSITASQKHNRLPFSAAQIRAIQIAEHIAAQITLILIATGCRPNELFSAQVANCYDGYFIGGSKTKAGKDRIIAVSPIGLDAYRELLRAAREKNSTLLIDGYAGNRKAANFAKRDFKDLMQQLHIDGMTPYNCRHTFTTFAVKSGVKAELLQDMLGHASYATTINYYKHLSLDDILRETQKITVANKLLTTVSGSK
jgi:integrase